MPKGQTPRIGSFARLARLEAELKRATTPTTVNKIATLFRAYTTGLSGDDQEAPQVRELRTKIQARRNSLLANSSKLQARQDP